MSHLAAVPQASNHRLLRRGWLLVGAIVSGPLFMTTSALATSGSTSQISRAPLPTGALVSLQNATINATSCPTVNNCVAVGSMRTAAGNQLLIDIEVNGSWSAGPRIALPSDRVWSWAQLPSPVTELTAVSCPDLTNCLAVGTYLTASGFAPLSVNESNGQWQAAVRVAAPANAATANQSTALLGVDCPTAGNCEAVGTYFTTSANNVEPWAISEHHAIWDAPQVPALPTGALTTDQVGALSGIDCTAMGNCTAVGGDVTSTGFRAIVLVKKLNLWPIAANGVGITLPANAANPAEATANTLNAVSCTAVSQCVAVGQYLTSSGYKPMTTSESLAGWATAASLTVPTISAPTGPLGASLLSISCLDALTCESVGAYGTTSVQLPFIATMSSGVWSSGTTANLPSDASVSKTGQLDAVTCFAPGQCVLAGNYLTTSGTEAVVATPTTVSSPPINIVAVAANTKATVTWSAPTYHGNTPIISYVVTTSNGSSSCSTTVLSCTVNALTNGSPYSFTVVAINAVGPSASSAPSAAVTPATVPTAAAIATVQSRRGALRIIILAPSSNGGAPLLTYQYSLNGGVSWHARASGTTSTTLDVTGLTRQHTYWVAVRAINRVGAGARSGVVRVTTH